MYFLSIPLENHMLLMAGEIRRRINDVMATYSVRQICRKGDTYAE